VRPVLRGRLGRLDRRQLDEGRFHLIPTRVPMVEAIPAAVDPLRRLASVKQLRLEVGGEPCAARADPPRLRVALTNLIDNRSNSRSRAVR
jgi:signal transduction histidine kinase